MDPESESERWLAPHIPCLREAGRRVLNLGCGQGQDDAVLVRAGFDVTGCDILAEALRKARVVCPEGRYFRSDLRAPLPLAGASFDVVLASLSLHYFHWDQTAAAFDEARRVLRDGGRFLFRVNARDDINFGARGGTIVERGLRRYEQGESDRPLKRFFSSDDLRRLLRDGWEIEGLKHCSTFRWGPEKRVWMGLARRS